MGIKFDPILGKLVSVGGAGPQGPQGDPGEGVDLQVTNTLYVDNKRTDVYVENGTILKPFKTIQAAIDAVISPGAHNKYLIEISPGEYYSDPIAINKIYVTFRSCGVNGARISGKITITNPSDPTPEQITFVGMRISGGLDCFASHICINVVDSSVTGGDWTFNPTVPTDDEYLQVWGGIWYANAILTNVYTYLMGGGLYSIFTVSGCEFNINNADINDPFEAILSGTVIGSAFGNRAGGSKFTLNTGSNLHIDADTEGGSIITIAGGTLTRSTKASNIINDSNLFGETVKDALESISEALARPEEVAYNPIYPLNDPLVSAQRTILYFPSGFDIGGLGTSYKYVMIWSNDWYNVLKVSGSNDFKTWTYVTDCVGVNAGSHPCIVQLTPTSFRLYYMSAAITYSITDLRTATTIDLVNFSDEQPLQNDLLKPIVTGLGVGWNRGSYGMCDVKYNPTASNIGTDPRNYSYMAYYDVTDGAFESIALAYSSNGIIFSLYGDAPILEHSTSTWGDNLIWDSSYVTGAQVIKADSKYLMLYCGGITSVLEGVGSAISEDGLVWKKMSVNHQTICPTRGAWNNTTISFPSVVVDLATRFAGAGELADVKIIMTGGIAATWEYSNGAYIIPHLFVPIEESVYHIQPYCLPDNLVLKVGSDDIEITDTTKGIILKSPDGTRWRITIGNDGSLSQEELL